MSSKRQQATLLNFLTKKSRLTEETPFNDSSDAANQAAIRGDSAKDVSEELTTIPSITADLDIGRLLENPSRPDDVILFQLLTNHWKPPIGYNFPFSEHNKGGKCEKRYLKRTHLEEFPWLVFSDVQQGLFCLYCPYFASEVVNS